MIVEKASKQICPQTALSSGVAIRTTKSGRVFRDILWTAFDFSRKKSTSHTIRNLLYTGTATSYALVDRPHVPKTTANATGDVITTDGQLSVLELGTTKPNIINPPTPVLQTCPAQASQ